MWFKNLTFFRLTENFNLTYDELAEKLATLSFQPAGPHQLNCFGWTPPLNDASGLVHVCNGFMMFCAKKEEKVLPAKVVNELAASKINDVETQEGRKLSKKERSNLKEELIFDLLPKAFTFSRKTYAYIDLKGHWLIVDSASAKSAEELLSHLRKCLGSLPAVPVKTLNKPSVVMTEWLLFRQLPKDMVVEDDCELRSPEEDGGIIRCRRHDLTVPEIKNHLDSGKLVTRLAVSWSDRIAFVLDEHLAIKRLRFLDVLREQAADIDCNSEAERFDADFSIMSLELSQFLPRLLDWFGGESTL